uniref:Ubiquitin carboxyl-terminal hydrolase n=1 Tax=Sphaeramia orbicularis TaxID=375764 RepID=A0A673CV71_9TELE
MDSPRWLPLESNPEVCNFLSSLGMKPTWQFGDVYGLDPELLSMVPRPVCAVLLLFPVTEKYEAFKQEEEERLRDQQQASSDVYFIKQTIGNACGTIGLIHAVANNLQHLEFEPDSSLKKFLQQTTKMTPEERAAFLEKDESIRVTHESSAQEGQTEAPSIDEKVNLHFIAFVNVGGQLFELAPLAILLSVFYSFFQAVTKKKFGSSDFRSALENGVLLCDLINKIKPGIIKRVNRLPTPIAGLDNLNVFLRACGKLGLKEAQLFHPGDLQDLSTRVTVKHQETNRRLKNVLITLYWLGRRAQCDPFYDGPYLNFKAFEGLLGTALYKALQESSSQKGSNVRDSGFGDSWYSEREELHHLRGGGGGEGGGGGHRRDDSLDSLDSLGSRPHSISSDTTLKGSSEGCCSDTEADSVFRMAENRDTSYRRSVVITPKSTTQFNQFLPTKDKSSGYVPAPLRKKRAERNEDSRRSWANPMYTEDDAPLTSCGKMSAPQCGSVRVDHRRAVCADSLFKEIYDDSEDEDDEVGYADPIQDDLYTRKVGVKPQPAKVSYDKFLPKFWTPDEDIHIQKIKLGSQKRPWYKKMQGLRCVKELNRWTGFCYPYIPSFLK